MPLLSFFGIDAKQTDLARGTMISRQGVYRYPVMFPSTALFATGRIFDSFHRLTNLWTPGQCEYSKCSLFQHDNKL
jgi:hypothetical protein